MDAALRSHLGDQGITPECIETIVLTRDVLARVGDRWTVLVINALASEPLRFGALHKRLAGVSARMLSQTLRLLTKDGLVTRTVYAEAPPRVEYSLTSLGRSFSESIDGVVRWVQEHQPEITKNRLDFELGAAQELTR
ncbi:helix-turn-helix domain-containing protein [Actinomadura sp. B10D3]|uniref:winged helix-turn-helix transcriptional regulator n=1 Tax=Actinomadura sp. B10D3 TaxID=3153557 RepID=UPI00325F4FF5